MISSTEVISQSKTNGLATDCPNPHLAESFMVAANFFIQIFEDRLVGVHHA
jgi:hypothetical protein